MDNVLISACLLGLGCRYDGDRRQYDLKNLHNKYKLIPVCPEIYGGLPTPRAPSEIIGHRVINKDGVDVTAQYNRGAQEALRLAKMFHVKFAVLKAKSPSCGKGEVYDGTFTRTLASGDGIAARLLLDNGIQVFTEEEIGKIV